MTAFNGDPMIGQHPDTATPVYLTPQARDTAEVVNELHEDADRITAGILSQIHAIAVERGRDYPIPQPVIEVTRPYSAPDFGGTYAVESLAKVLPFARPVGRRRVAAARAGNYAAAP